MKVCFHAFVHTGVLLLIPFTTDVHDMGLCPLGGGLRGKPACALYFVITDQSKQTWTVRDAAR